MQNTFYKLAGYCLITGCFLMVVTMVLHPTGGSLQHIASISTIAIVSHSIAVLSIPFTAFGFYGLAKKIETGNRLSFLALSFAGFALIAVLFAAALNGLVLPMYVLNHPGQAERQSDTMNLIANYGVTFNAALDYIFITGYSIAMLLWSFTIAKKKILPRWFGIFGLGLVVLTLIAGILQLKFISVPGFRLYVFGIVSWINIAAYFLIKGRR